MFRQTSNVLLLAGYDGGKQLPTRSLQLFVWTVQSDVLVHDRGSWCRSTFEKSFPCVTGVTGTYFTGSKPINHWVSFCPTKVCLTVVLRAGTHSWVAINWFVQLEWGINTILDHTYVLSMEGIPRQRNMLCLSLVRWFLFDREPNC